MATLVNITPNKPNAVQIWGFHGECDVDDVAAALNKIGPGLSGTNNVINVMSGTHGFCDGMVGAVASREQKFAAEDRSLASPKTKDGKPVTVNVHDFNLVGVVKSKNASAEAMSLLNQDIRSIVGASSGVNNVFLLAYCCSAGTE